jgi:hypothetical protein
MQEQEKEYVSVSSFVDAAEEITKTDQEVAEATMKAVSARKTFEEIRYKLVRQYWEQSKLTLNLMIAVWRCDPRL